MMFSEKTCRIRQSLTRQLFDLAKKYDDVVDLTLGDPDLSPCDEIKNAACRAILEGNTHYSSNAGLPEARKAIASFSSREYNKSIFENNVLVTVGGMEGIYLLLNALLNRDDEVIVFSPCYVNYIQMVLLCDAKPVVVPFIDDGNFSIDLEIFEQSVTSRTKVVILNSPNNPTGKIVDEGTIRKIADIAVRNNLFVILDEVYRSLVYDDGRFFSMYSLEGIEGNCAVVDSMSKRYSMTGYRLGYVICNEELVDCMVKLQENIVACAPLPSQYAAIEAYGNGISNEYVKNEFMRRRDFMLGRIGRMDSLSMTNIDASFYAFVNIGRLGMKSLDFSMKLLERAHVAVVPGITYEEDCDNYVRIAFTKDVKILEVAMNRIEKFIREIENGK